MSGLINFWHGLTPGQGTLLGGAFVVLAGIIAFSTGAMDRRSQHKRFHCDRTVRRLIADGELTGYRMGRGNQVIRIDFDEIDEKLMRPIGGSVWRTTPPTVTASKATNPRAVTVQPGTPPKVDPLDKTFYRFCKCGHPGRDHSPGGILGEPRSVGPCHAPTWENIPGQLSRDTRPCRCKEFDEDVKRRRSKPKKYQG